MDSYGCEHEVITVEGEFMQCVQCDRRVPASKAPAPATTLNRTGDDFLRALIYDKQQIFTCMYRNGEIRDDRNQLAFTYRGPLPADKAELLSLIHAAISGLFCVSCDQRLPEGSDAICRDCQLMVRATLRQNRQHLID